MQFAVVENCTYLRPTKNFLLWLVSWISSPMNPYTEILVGKHSAETFGIIAKIIFLYCNGISNYFGILWRDNKPFNPPRKCKIDEYSVLQSVIFGTGFSRNCPSAQLPGVSCDKNLVDALIVHIRSGDIFRRDRPNPNYGQPPLYFYYQIFKLKHWKHIHFITSPTHSHLQNPIFTYFHLQRQKYNYSIIPKGTKVTFQQSRNLTYDWHTMLCARYFASSKSTLSQMIVDLSPYLREVYLPSPISCEQASLSPGTVASEQTTKQAVICHEIDLLGYSFKNWTNSKQARLRMFNHGFNQTLFQSVPGDDL